jgi:hypothetical protein
MTYISRVAAAGSIKPGAINPGIPNTAKIIELGESGLKKRKEANKASASQSNPFATDPSLLMPEATNEETGDIFDEDFDDDQETTEESNQSHDAGEGEGPV